MNKLATLAKSLLGRVMIACAALLALGLTTSAVMADDISTTTSTVSGYVTAAIAVGIAVLLFVLGRKVLRRLVALAFCVYMASNSAFAVAPVDIAETTTAVSGYVTAAIAVGIAVLLFVLGRKVLRRLV